MQRYRTLRRVAVGDRLEVLVYSIEARGSGVRLERGDRVIVERISGDYCAVRVAGDRLGVVPLRALRLVWRKQDVIRDFLDGVPPPDLSQPLADTAGCGTCPVRLPGRLWRDAVDGAGVAESGGTE